MNAHDDRTAQLQRHSRRTVAEHMRPTWSGNVPHCDEACPLFDGKRCRAMACRPGLICEPAVEAMGALWRRAEADLQDARRDAVDLVIDRRQLAGATPLGDETCTQCGERMGWGLPVTVGASGYLRCTRCSATGRRIIRLEDGSVVGLPDGVETYAGDLARRLRAGGGR